MRKKVKIKHAEEFNEMHSRSLVLDDPGAAAAYAAQEAFAAGVSPSAVMYSSPDGAATGEDLVASEDILANSAPEEPVVEPEPKVEVEVEAEPDGEKAEAPKLDKAIKPALDKSLSIQNSAPEED
jgi:hypothetical protein